MDGPAQDGLGIVLSGGGTRGVAQIGVLRALGERGIHPEWIAGVSAGAVVGALYAAGHAPAEMLEFFVKKNPFQVSKLAIAKPGFIDTAKVVADFEEYFPENSFESLNRKLRIVATDIVRGESVVFDSGPLIPPVLASSSVPLVFTPTEIDGRAFSDGGIINNFPVSLIEDRCRVLLGVYVSPLRTLQPDEITSSLSVLKRALEVGMFQASKVKFARCDVVISPPGLSRVSPFATKHLEDVEALGYLAATEQMPRIERAVARLSG